LFHTLNYRKKTRNKPDQTKNSTDLYQCCCDYLVADD